MVSSLIQVGVISAAHGIRGQVKIRSLTLPPEHITKLSHFTDASGNRQYVITLRKGAPPVYIADIKDISDRNAAELLKGTKLYALLETSETRESALIGKPAHTSDDAFYGTIHAIVNYGAGEVVEIEKTDGTQEMLPLNDNFFLMGKDKITVFPPEYMEGDKK